MNAPHNWLEILATTEDPAARDHLLSRSTFPQGAHSQLQEAFLQVLYLDRPRATRLANAAARLAAITGDEEGLALAERSFGHLAYLRGEYSQASAHYHHAADLFTAGGMEVELARTLSSSLQALIYQGSYAEAEAAAARAEAIFARHGDLLRLARLDSNVGNIFFRQDRPREALARYHRALEGFQHCGEPRDIAAALSNLAVCNTSLGDFAAALSSYSRARDFCALHGFAGLIVRADYNIAYLHYLRGDYAEARRLYALTREQCAVSSDTYHAALCDLDEAELFLELNLNREGGQLARQAAVAFEKLKMPYEQGKALVSLAIAASQRAELALADTTLRQARRVFQGENNRIWPALVDQLRAVLAFHQQNFHRAQRLSASARRILANTPIPGRAAHSQILLARLWLRAGFADRARATARDALERLGAESSPSVRFHAALIDGEIHETQGRPSDALAAYENARSLLEDIRGRLDTEDLRISVLADKLAVYESLVSLRLDGPPSALHQAFLCVQQAKSRTLADRLASSWRPPPASPRLSEIRKELHWVYRQIDLASLIHRAAPTDRLQSFRQQALALEAEWTDASRTSALPAQPEPESLSSIQAVLLPGEALLEYYEVRGSLHLFILCRQNILSLRLGPCAPIRQAVKLLLFQLQKLSVPPPARQPSQPPLEAASAHLRDLHRLLIEPASQLLQPFHRLIIAPHKNLHGVPFAALHEGNLPLIERFALCFTPSASVFARCRRRPPSPHGPPVIVAVPDARAPRIAEEAGEVAALLPGARLFNGPDATLDNLRLHGSGSTVLHLAAHGTFRRDNPLFSSIQLADGPLHLIDLNSMNLHTGLLTLSACSSGSSVPVGGDELLGLIRGCLAAGARSLLVTLWEIDDASTRDFMTVFYTRAVAGDDLSAALAFAMRAIRSRHPHPFFWAPYILVGDPAPLPIS